MEVCYLVHIISGLFLNGSVDGVPATSLGKLFHSHY